MANGILARILSLWKLFFLLGYNENSQDCVTPLISGLWPWLLRLPESILAINASGWSMPTCFRPEVPKVQQEEEEQVSPMKLVENGAQTYVFEKRHQTAIFKSQKCIPLQRGINLSNTKPVPGWPGQDLSEDNFCHTAGSLETKGLRNSHLSSSPPKCQVPGSGLRK